MDKEGTCYPVMLYNLRTGCGVIVGDAVAIPEPYVQSTDFQENDKVYCCSFPALAKNQHVI